MPDAPTVTVYQEAQEEHDGSDHYQDNPAPQLRILLLQNLLLQFQALVVHLHKTARHHITV